MVSRVGSFMKTGLALFAFYSIVLLSMIVLKNKCVLKADNIPLFRAVACGKFCLNFTEGFASPTRSAHFLDSSSP